MQLVLPLCLLSDALHIHTSVGVPADWEAAVDSEPCRFLVSWVILPVPPSAAVLPVPSDFQRGVLQGF